MSKCRVYASLNWVSIGLGVGFGLSPVRRKAQTIADLLSFVPIRTNFNEIRNEINKSIHENAFENVSKMAAILNDLNMWHRSSYIRPRLEYIQNDDGGDCRSVSTHTHPQGWFSSGRNVFLRDTLKKLEIGISSISSQKVGRDTGRNILFFKFVFWICCLKYLISGIWLKFQNW